MAGHDAEWSYDVSARQPITDPVLVGCCGWSEAQARYVADFPVIELQSPFYQMPADRVAERWRALASPSQFQFCIKAWQLITHTPASPTYRRLKDTISAGEQDLFGSFRPTEQVWLAWERTRRIADLLDSPVIVFQCPRSFLPTRENIRNLRAFFSSIETTRVLAWEPRGADWNKELVADLCQELNLVHCVDPFEASPAYGDILYWRLHGISGYKYRYTDEDLNVLGNKLREYAGKSGYVMFNNVYSRVDAQRFVEWNRDEDNAVSGGN